jgi:hypothetical protein
MYPETLWKNMEKLSESEINRAIATRNYPPPLCRTMVDIVIALNAAIQVKWGCAIEFYLYNGIAFPNRYYYALDKCAHNKWSNGYEKVLSKYGHMVDVAPLFRSVIELKWMDGLKCLFDHIDAEDIRPNECGTIIRLTILKKWTDGISTFINWWNQRNRKFDSNLPENGFFRLFKSVADAQWIEGCIALFKLKCVPTGVDWWNPYVDYVVEKQWKEGYNFLMQSIKPIREKILIEYAKNACETRGWEYGVHQLDVLFKKQETDEFTVIGEPQPPAKKPDVAKIQETLVELSGIVQKLLDEI